MTATTEPHRRALRRPLALLTALLLLAGPAAEARAHGGAYKGPTDAGGAGGGGRTGFSPAGGTVLTPGATGAGGSAFGAGAGSSGGGTRGRSARGGAGGASRSSVVAYDGWEYWWESNRDRYIGLRARLGHAAARAGSPAQLTGRGVRRAGTNARPDRQTIDGLIIPALTDISREADDRDVLDSTLVALGRSASPDTRALALERAEALLAHRELSVQGAAALCLGLLGDGDSVELLDHLLHDDSHGRAAVGGGQVPWIVRSFAAIALGLVHDDRSVALLTAAVVELPDSDRDVKACALAALGLLPRTDPNQPAVEAFLVERLADARLDPFIRSYVPTSLGKVGGPACVPALLACYRAADTENVVRQSAAIGLG